MSHYYDILYNITYYSLWQSCQVLGKNRTYRSLSEQDLE